MPDTLAQSIGHALETLFDALDYDEGNQQARWSEEVERRLKENGLTYQAHTSKHHQNRQGQLDVVPYLMDESTFGHLARGLSQRMRFFEALINDPYGDRNLLADGSVQAVAVLEVDPSSAAPTELPAPRAPGSSLFSPCPAAGPRSAAARSARR